MGHSGVYSLLHLKIIWLVVHIVGVWSQSVTVQYTTSCSNGNQNIQLSSSWTLTCDYVGFTTSSTTINQIRWLTGATATDNQLTYVPGQPNDGITGGAQQTNVQSVDAQSTYLSITLTSFSSSDLAKWTCEVDIGSVLSANFELSSSTPTCNGLVSCYVCIPTTEPITEDNLANTTICSQTTNCAYCKKSVTQNGGSKTAVRSCESSCSQDETTGTYCCNNEDLCNPASTITPDLLLPFALVLTAVQCAYGIY